MNITQTSFYKRVAAPRQARQTTFNLEVHWLFCGINLNQTSFYKPVAGLRLIKGYHWGFTGQQKAGTRN